MQAKLWIQLETLLFLHQGNDNDNVKAVLTVVLVSVSRRSMSMYPSAAPEAAQVLLSQTTFRTPRLSLMKESQRPYFTVSLIEISRVQRIKTIYDCCDPPDYPSSGLVDDNPPGPAEVEDPGCASTVSDEESCDITCPPDFSDDSNTESESEGEPDSLINEVS